MHGLTSAPETTGRPGPATQRRQDDRALVRPVRSEATMSDTIIDIRAESCQIDGQSVGDPHDEDCDAAWFMERVPDTGIWILKGA